MPAEWVPHQATWISWPHNADTWPGCVDQAELAMARVVAALAPRESVHINVRDPGHRAHVAKLLAGGVPPEAVRFEYLATDDAWIRDYGAIVVANDGPPGGADSAKPVPAVALDFGYNAWGGKYPPWDRDADVARQMAAQLGLGRVEVDMILEGGSIEVNGAGLGLSTEACLLNPNRNPNLDRADIEARLMRYLGLDEIVWLGDGIDGDDTDGHIDNLARFVNENRLVAVIAEDQADPNHRVLADNLARLEAFRDQRRPNLEIVGLPVPDPVIHRGQRLPASYANFYIANGLVLVPAYGTSVDGEAQAILTDCFPGRRIVPVDCRALIVGLGALHCLTQQIPVIVADSTPAEQ